MTDLGLHTHRPILNMSIQVRNQFVLELIDRTFLESFENLLVELGHTQTDLE